MVWPAGMGLNFKGVLDLYSDEFSIFGREERVGYNMLGALLADDIKAKLDEEVELARAGLPAFRR